MGQLLEVMLADRERAQRFARLKEAIAATPAAQRDGWRAENQAYEATLSDGLDGA